MKVETLTYMLGRQGFSVLQHEETGAILFKSLCSFTPNPEGWISLIGEPKFIDKPTLHFAIDDKGEHVGWLLFNGEPVKTGIFCVNGEVDLKPARSLWDSVYITVVMAQTLSSKATELTRLPSIKIPKQLYLSHLGEIRKEISELLTDITLSIERGK